MDENKIKIELTEHQLFLIRNAVEDYSLLCADREAELGLSQKYTQQDFQDLEILIENVFTGES